VRRERSRPMARLNHSPRVVTSFHRRALSVATSDPSSGRR
jgi:hypothetical protein